MSVKRIESNPILLHVFHFARVIVMFEVLHTGKEIVTLFKAWSRIRMQSIAPKNVMCYGFAKQYRENKSSKWKMQQKKVEEIVKIDKRTIWKLINLCDSLCSRMHSKACRCES